MATRPTPPSNFTGLALSATLLGVAACGTGLLGLTGCDEEPAKRVVKQGPQPNAAPPVAPPISPPPSLEPLPMGEAYAGPPVTLDIDRSGDRPIIRVSAEVPTGGWKLVFDRCEVDPGLEARVYATLVRPAPNVNVSQALETLRKNWRSSDPFERSKLYVRELIAGRPSIGKTWDLAVKIQ